MPWAQAETLYTTSEEPLRTGRGNRQPSRSFTLAMFFCFWLVISSFFLLLYAQRYLL